VDLERHCRWIGLSVLQRIHNVEVIFHYQVIHDERCLSAATYIDTVSGNGNGPEQAIVQTGIEVVHLITTVRSLRPRVEVDSNEGEDPLPVAAVSTDVFAGHETHVGIELAAGRRRYRTAGPAP